MQRTSTNQLKAFVHDLPAMERRNDMAIGKKTSSKSANKSVISRRNKKDEIFIDLIEHVNVVFDSKVYFNTYIYFFRVKL